MFRVLKPLFVFLSGMVVAVLGAEFFVANFIPVDNPPGQFRRSPTRAFEHVPHFKGKDRLGNPILINSHGFRDREIAPEKKADVYRILVLGDSIAFGDGIAAEQTFSKQLEELFKDSAIKVEVLNGGIRGYNTYQELLLLKEVGLSLEPDLVVLLYVGNDAEPFDRQKGLIDPRYGVLIQLKEWIKQHSYLYAFFRKNLEVLRQVTRSQKMIEKYADQFDEGNPGWISSFKSLGDMKKLTDEKGVGLVVAVCPRLEGLAPGQVYPLKDQKVHDQVLKACRELGIETIDLLQVFRGQDPQALRVTATDSFHPNPKGNFLIAAALKDFVVSKSFLSRKESL